MRLTISNLLGPQIRGPSFMWVFFLVCALAASTAFSKTTHAASSQAAPWQAAVKAGDFDRAADLAEGGSSALGRLIAESDRLNLHKAPLWRALLHYRSTLSGVKSQVDSPWFFQSDQGKRNSQAEMHATLAAFFKQEA